ncbi:shikimate kinase [Actinoalloteichus hymeniacidonis]|uniref:Shikimate kinase n=1 Tax=Actinoalloteichus hymeniacidonis TaxID=340345 RepID=A0AAC9HPS5_9PSEU|nr:shikimate kinase [Actinoalloteichus hymeniacidonis]AOS63098.1 shikimate kinase [Actinoalloteichus hymeniacidonis]MBB5908866.1 shikimate kinase [Actinoalloteichus hymeniacidonis]
MSGSTPIVLVGPPGAGKSTTGRLLAGRLGLGFLDVDDEIERQAGRTVAEIFTGQGEDVFRKWERDTVRRSLVEHRGVLALGGGAVLADETRSLLREHTVVFLNVGMAEGVRRTGLSSNRPLLAGINPRATFKALLDARLPLYREVASLEVITDRQSADEVAVAVLTELAALDSGDAASGSTDAGPAEPGTV